MPETQYIGVFYSNGQLYYPERFLPLVFDMTRANFPYLTPQMLESDGDSLLSWVATLWPESLPVVKVLQELLPIVEKITAVRKAIIACCDHLNAITGAPVPS